MNIKVESVSVSNPDIITRRITIDLTERQAVALRNIALSIVSTGDTIGPTERFFDAIHGALGRDGVRNNTVLFTSSPYKDSGRLEVMEGW